MLFNSLIQSSVKLQSEAEHRVVPTANKDLKKIETQTSEEQDGLIVYEK